jgi:choline-glycine betaine transporter
MDETQLQQWARARVRQLRALYLHVGVYVVVMLFLLLINAVTRDTSGSYMFAGHMHHRGGGDWWVIWPALGWGVLVALHAIVVLIGGTGKLDNWEDRKVEELVTRERDRTSV